MSETPDPPEIVVTAQKGAHVPPAVYATTVHVALSAPEVTVLLGRTRQVIDPNINSPMPNALMEWFQSISLSPVAAKQLANSLSHAVQAYERLFGEIPDDPTFTLAPLPEPRSHPKSS